MKFLIVFALVIVSALAAPPKQAARPARASDSANAQILKYENDNIGLDGEFYRLISAGTILSNLFS